MLLISAVDRGLAQNCLGFEYAREALQVARGPGANPEGIAARLSVKRVEGSFSLVR